MTGKDYIVYKQRWLILAGVLACSFIRGYLPGMFAISNDIMTVYFRITPLQADMLTSVDGATAVCVCLAFAVVGKKVGVRMLSLTMAVSSFTCSVAIGIAITSRDLYVLMLFGRIVSGISAGVTYILPPILANAWFPSDQVATAASIPILAIATGGVIAPIVFSNLLSKVDLNVTFDNATTNSSSGFGEFGHLQNVYYANTALFLMLSVFAIAISYAFAKNHPSTPPSSAQALLLKTCQKDGERKEHDLRSLLDILRLRQFWSIVAVSIINSATTAFSIYLQPSMMKATFPSASNAVAGYCLVLTTITSGCGSITAGKVLDRWHRYKHICLLGLLLGGGCCLAIVFSHLYRIMWMFFVFHAIVGFLRLFTYVCNVELLLEVTYPQDATGATCLFFAFYNLSAFLWTPLERWVMVFFGEQYVTWVAVISQVAAAVMLLLSNTTYKRTQANRSRAEHYRSTEMGSNSMGAES